jgi:chromate transporter
MATVGVCVPSFIIIFLISLFFDAFLSFTIVEYAFRGIQACVIYLVFSAGLKMLKQMKKTTFNTIIILTTLICVVVFSLLAVKFSTIFYILISGACGVAVYLIDKIKKEEKQ